MKSKHGKQKYVLCIRNNECEDLEPRKIYPLIIDEDAAKEGYFRIIDESGEDYLYPESYFVSIELSQTALNALQMAN